MIKLPNLPDSDRCSCCGGCLDACKHKALTMGFDKNGYNHITLNKDACIGCLACEKACPVIGERIGKGEAHPYWAWATDNNLRATSTSGGTFSQLAADFFIANPDGLVVGATLVDGLTVKHIAIEKREDIIKLQGSKYLQSNTEGIYEQTLKALRNQRPVFFSGTPCQVAAINRRVEGKAYAALLTTCEVICHGIPSYLHFRLALQVNNAESIVTFRSKNSGWGGCYSVYSTEYKHDNGYFYDCFFNDIYLKPACYNCRFASLPRVADISIADGWGIQETAMSSEEIKKGVSLVLANSDAGSEILAKSNLFRKQAEWRHFLPLNPCIIMNLSYLRDISMSKHIHAMIHCLPRPLYLSMFAMKSENRGWGVLAKCYIKLMLWLKSRRLHHRHNAINHYIQTHK